MLVQMGFGQDMLTEAAMDHGKNQGMQKKAKIDQFMFMRGITFLVMQWKLWLVSGKNQISPMKIEL